MRETEGGLTDMCKREREGEAMTALAVTDKICNDGYQEKRSTADMNDRKLQFPCRNFV